MQPNAPDASGTLPAAKQAYAAALRSALDLDLPERKPMSIKDLVSGDRTKIQQTYENYLSGKRCPVSEEEHRALVKQLFLAANPKDSLAAATKRAEIRGALEQAWKSVVVARSRNKKAARTRPKPSGSSVATGAPPPTATLSSADLAASPERASRHAPRTEEFRNVLRVIHEILSAGIAEAGQWSVNAKGRIQELKLLSDPLEFTLGASDLFDPWTSAPQALEELDKVVVDYESVIAEATELMSSVSQLRESLKFARERYHRLQDLWYPMSQSASHAYLLHKNAAVIAHLYDPTGNERKPADFFMHPDNRSRLLGPLETYGCDSVGKLAKNANYLAALSSLAHETHDRVIALRNASDEASRALRVELTKGGIARCREN